jgi:phosphoenolpyruvate carboxykinase (ATP)
MSIQATMTPTDLITRLGINHTANMHYQLAPEELIQHTIDLKQGVGSSHGALVVNTGKFTGRSPDDRFFVMDGITSETINWNKFNIPIEEKYYQQLKKKLLDHINESESFYVRDCFACAAPQYRLNIRVVTETPWSNLFAYNMFIRPTEQELEEFEAEWYVIQSASFKADPAVDGTRQENFSIVSFTEKTIIIGGSGYTGEIKKGIFTVLNYLMPYYKDVLSMHCSANMGKSGDTAVFFGLSGTGKTTLSADPNRYLIGDDEHGWTDDSIFNFEGGCYAKTINLSKDNEPEIYKAVQLGALVENTPFTDGTNEIDFDSAAITENTRVSYPLHFIHNAKEPSIGTAPSNIFFLTCDAAGVIPPISKLSPGQAMYQFISGYTAKVAGTEAGVTEPKSTFSACFGAPFMPLHPGFYAEMLGRKMVENQVNVWLVNTGWVGGPYGVGNRVKLKYTRAMIAAALEDKLTEVSFDPHPVFGFMVPNNCPGVPAEILNPRNTWVDKSAYDVKAKKLASLFIKNFEQYAPEVAEEILLAAPKV